MEAQAALNRPAFVSRLVAEWIPQVPDVAAMLADTTRTTLVADVGCGLGWATIELAKTYPHLHIDGYDSDEESISKARRNAAEAGVSDRVTFDVVDASGGYLQGHYDLVLFFECVHDMAHPVAAMAAARAAVAEGGTVIVMDERVGEQLTAGDPTETFFATASVLWCLPQAGGARLRSRRDRHAPRPIPSHRAGRRLVGHRRASDRPPLLAVLPTDAMIAKCPM